MTSKDTVVDLTLDCDDDDDDDDVPTTTTTRTTRRRTRTSAAAATATGSQRRAGRTNGGASSYSPTTSTSSSSSPSSSVHAVGRGGVDGRRHHDDDDDDDSMSDDDVDCNIEELKQKYQIGVVSSPSSTSTSTNFPSDAAGAGENATAGTRTPPEEEEEEEGAEDATPRPSKKRLRHEVDTDDDNDEEDARGACRGLDKLFSTKSRPEAAVGNRKTTNDDSDGVHDALVIEIDDSDDENGEDVKARHQDITNPYDPICELSGRVRQFLKAVGITKTEQLLARPTQIVTGQYVKWREENYRPKITESTIQSSVSSWKDQLRTITRMETADNPLDFIPVQAQKFLASVSIKTAEAFLKADTTLLARNFIEFRKNENMNAFNRPMMQAEHYVSTWKGLIRKGIRAKKQAAKAAASSVSCHIDPFPNLPRTAKEFLASIHVTTVRAFLVFPSQELSSKYEAWRREQGLPATKSVGSPISSWRYDIKMDINMKSSPSTDILSHLPPIGQNFLKAIGINDAQRFIDVPDSTLLKQYVTWREQNNLPDSTVSTNINSAERNIRAWKKSIRQGVGPKASSSSAILSYEGSSVGIIGHGTKSPLDVLSSRSRTFLLSIGVDSVDKLLAENINDLIQKYQDWRKQKQYCTLTEASILQAVSQWKVDVRRVLKIANGSDPFQPLPRSCRNFLSWCGITKPKDFLDAGTNELVSKLVEWRGATNMPPLNARSNGAEVFICDLKRMLRTGLELKEAADPNNGHVSLEHLQLSHDEVCIDHISSSDKCERGTSKDTNATSMCTQNGRQHILPAPTTDEDAVDRFSALMRVDQQFLSSVGIHDADDFLACRPDYLGSRLAEWLSDLGLPALPDPSRHIAALQKNVQMNREEMASMKIDDLPRVEKRRGSAGITSTNKFASRPLKERTEQTASKTTSSPQWRPQQTAAKSPLRHVSGQGAAVLKQPPRDQYTKKIQGQSLVPPCRISTVQCVEVAMQNVEDSSRSYIDKSTGLPVLEFSVHDEHMAGVEHDFRVHTAPSNIIGAGLGAFLTFVGSRQTTGTESSLPDTSFSLLPDRYIDLGKYGPHRCTDRKAWENYEIKSFLFSHEPCEWAWDLNVRGRLQAIDITDDETGMIHAEARDCCLVYVNETGNVDYLTPNVVSKEVGRSDDREIHYFYQSASSLQKGEQTELLINYKEGYEPVRERKGYGKRNLNGETKSDLHLASRLRRNFIERDDLRHIVLSLGTKKLSSLIPFLVSIKTSIVDAVKSLENLRGASSTPSKLPYAQQIVALRRLCWLRALLKKQFERIQKSGATTPETIAVIVENLEHLDWDGWGTLWDVLVNNPNLTDKRGLKILQSFQEEMMEEVLYSIKVALPYPFDEATWCNVAQRLLKDLCIAVVEKSLSKADETGEQRLLDYFKARSHVAANEILNHTTVDDLAFEASGVWKRYSIENRIIVKKEQPGAKCILINKRASSSMPEPFILTPFGSLDEVEVHKLWYLVRQVIVVLDAFTPFCPSADESHKVTLQLINELGISESTYRVFGFSIAIGAEDKVYLGKSKITSDEIKKSQDGWLLEMDDSWPANEETEDDDDVETNLDAILSFGDNGRANDSIIFSSLLRPAELSKENRGQMRTKNCNSSTKEKPKTQQRGYCELPPGLTLNEHHPPIEPLDGGWPDGWSRIVCQRKNGASAGQLDRYWFSPKEKIKLRSMVEVSKFIALLSQCGGNEIEAKRCLKNATKPNNDATESRKKKQKKCSPTSN